MFDDNGGRGGVEFTRGFEGGIGVHIVIIGHFLAVEDARGGEVGLGGRGDGGTEAGGLVRVFAIAQRDFGRGLAGEPGGDGGIVGRGAGKRFLGERLPRGVGQVAFGLQIGEHVGVVGGIGQDDDIRMVFGGGADHGRPADIHGFDTGVALKGVQVDAHQINGRQVELAAGFLVGGVVAALENAAMNARVEGLDAAIKDFRMPGVGGDIRHGQAGGAERGGGAAGGEQLHAERGEAAGQLQQAGFIGNTQQGATYFHDGIVAQARGNGKRARGTKKRKGA